MSYSRRWAGEFSAGREGARDIAGVTVEFAAGVYQAQFAGLQFGIPGAVMQHAGIGAGRHDAGVGRELRALAAELVQQFGFQVVFTQAALDGVAQHRGGGLHRAHVRAGRNFRRARRMAISWRP